MLKNLTYSRCPACGEAVASRHAYEPSKSGDGGERIHFKCGAEIMYGNGQEKKDRPCPNKPEKRGRYARRCEAAGKISAAVEAVLRDLTDVDPQYRAMMTYLVGQACRCDHAMMLRCDGWPVPDPPAADSQLERSSVVCPRHGSGWAAENQA